MFGTNPESDVAAWGLKFGTPTSATSGERHGTDGYLWVTATWDLRTLKIEVSEQRPEDGPARFTADVSLKREWASGCLWSGTGRTAPEALTGAGVNMGMSAVMLTEVATWISTP